MKKKFEVFTVSSAKLLAEDNKVTVLTVPDEYTRINY